MEFIKWVETLWNGFPIGGIQNMITKVQTIILMGHYRENIKLFAVGPGTMIHLPFAQQHEQGLTLIPRHLQSGFDAQSPFDHFNTSFYH